jgi:hypothetical protein
LLHRSIDRDHLRGRLDHLIVQPLVIPILVIRNQVLATVRDSARCSESM